GCPTMPTGSETPSPLQPQPYPHLNATTGFATWVQAGQRAGRRQSRKAAVRPDFADCDAIRSARPVADRFQARIAVASILTGSDHGQASRTMRHSHPPEQSQNQIDGKSVYASEGFRVG